MEVRLQRQEKCEEEHVPFFNLCLLCSEIPSIQDGIKCEIFTSSTNPEVETCNSGEDNSCLTTHLFSIFLLNKFLLFPKEQLGELLRTTGINPGSWCVLCDECSKLVRKAFQVYQRILKLERELGGLREEAYQKLKENLTLTSKNQKEDKRRNICDINYFIQNYFRGIFHPTEDESIVKVEAEHIGGDEDDIEGEENVKFQQNEEGEILEVVANDNDVEYTPSTEEEEDGESQGSSEEDDPISLPMSEGDNDDHHQDQLTKATLVDTNARSFYPEPSSSSMPRIPIIKHQLFIKPAKGIQRVSRYFCEICNMNFERKFKFSRHVNQHSFTCQKCGFKGRDYNSYACHVRSHKLRDSMEKTDFAPINGTIQVRCKICGFISGRREVYVHIGKNHPVELQLCRTYPCSLCGKQFNSREGIKQHIRIVHENRRKYTCSKCGFRSNCRRRFASHWVRRSCPAEEEEVKTEIENKSSASTARSQNKKRKVKPVYVYAPVQSKLDYFCEICDLPLPSRGGFSAHMKEHGLECKKCDFKGKDPNSLTTHYRSHKITDKTVSLGNNKFSCKLCKFEGGRRQIFTHVAETHATEINLRQLFPCHACPKQFASKALLTQHLKVVHEQIRPYHCDQCTARFLWKQDFEDHKVTHEVDGKGNWICEECGRGFIFKKHLTAHQKRPHKQPRPKKVVKKEEKVKVKIEKPPPVPKCECTYCGEKILNKPLLTLHTRQVHPEVFKHRCTMCSEGLYMCHKALKKHVERMHSHSEETQFVCPKKCGFVTLASYNLRRHVNMGYCRFYGKGFQQGKSGRGGARLRLGKANDAIKIIKN